ncbi:hypothetical protein WJU23_09075 [Prosthecobacter sp. SYSU 5D2]|uniref:TPM domain-containing protein n=1 Tax=Prosthecobacter sp. SYSU 5D2 TaxID=3134134 RepID=UPI0031FF03DB
MRCPACRTPALEHDASCGQCGFSLDALGPVMGIPPMLDAPLADVARTLSAGRRREVLKTVHALHQRFPQLSFAAVLMEVPPQVPLAIQAFWLFNRASLFSAVERAGDNHGVLLLLDTPRRRAVTMIGYGLEPLLSELSLEVCLTAASGSLAKGQFGPAIEAFVRELERQLTHLTATLPRVFGHVEPGLWQAPDSGDESETAPATSEVEDLY